LRGEELRTVLRRSPLTPRFSLLTPERVLMNPWNRSISLGNSIAEKISGGIALLVTLLISLDVILRYIFRDSIPASVEFTQVLLVLLVYLALGKAQEAKQHIRVEFLLEKLSPGMRRTWEIVIHFFALVFIAIVFWESIGLFIDSVSVMEYYGGAVRVPIYPARGAILVGCGLMTLQLVKDLIDLLSPKSKLVEVASPEVREIEEAIQKMEEEQGRK
jgi:TRAP-type C4-dicarboxylate transport system permease small subunit